MVAEAIEMALEDAKAATIMTDAITMVIEIIVVAMTADIRNPGTIIATAITAKVAIIITGDTGKKGTIINKNPTKDSTKIK